MIDLSPEADLHMKELEEHFEAKHRLEAARNLLVAVETAKARIAEDPVAGLPAPRPYPELKALELLWIFERRYWIAYTPTLPPVIAGIFYETSDIPSRI